MKQKISEIALKIKQDNPEKLGKMNEKKIATIVRKTLMQLKNEIENTENDIIEIPMFGKFSARMIEREKEGEVKIIRRITFRPSKKTK